MRSETASVLIQSLKGNSFFDSSLFSSMLGLHLDSPTQLKRLLGGERGYEVIFRSKHDRAYRPGAHLSPQLAYDYCDLFQYLDEAYFRYADEYSGSVFSVALFPWESDGRKQGNIVKPYGGQLSSLGKAIQEKARSYPFIAVIDIEDFYRSISEVHLRQGLAPVNHIIGQNTLDELLRIVEIYGFGLPQGYLVSDIVARLILTELDQWLTRNGFHFVRYVDDIYLFASEENELERVKCSTRNFLWERQLRVSKSKESLISGSYRTEWLSKGVNWGNIPIESYIDGEESLSDNDYFESYSDFHSGPVAYPAGLDLVALFYDHIVPPKSGTITDSGNRFVLRQICQHYPSILEENIATLIEDRSCNCRVALEFECDIAKDSASHLALLSLAGDLASPDDTVVILSKMTLQKAQDYSFKFIHQLPFERGLRASHYRLNSGSEKYLPFVIDSSLAYNGWTDEKAAIAGYLLSQESMAGKALATQLSRDRMFGFYMESANFLRESKRLI